MNRDISRSGADQPLIAQLERCQQQMQRQGVRRLLVLSGEAAWCQARVEEIIRPFIGDWLWISPNLQPNFKTLAPEVVNQLLGQECLHGVFDAREGVNVEALAAFSGVLRAGSWLIMLVPEWQIWPQLPDADSRRWSDQAEAIATPQFIARFTQKVQSDSQAIIWRQGEDCAPCLLASTPSWSAPQGNPTARQQAILEKLLKAQAGVWVLTAARGRGKSTLAGMLVQQWQGTCWMSAPSKAAGKMLSVQGEHGAQFWSPDALLAHCEKGAPIDADWLLIDEAAAIPTPLLAQLITSFPRVLLTTTVQGYEGTGRGFLLKFCASLPHWHDLRLLEPIRWAQGCPLELLLDDILLFNEPESITAVSPSRSVNPLHFLHFTAEVWAKYPERLAAFYHLLTSAHYRTSPLDLRRMMDAPGSSFSIAQRDECLVAALWTVDEGGLEPDFAHEIWAGRRRPRGSLVAQSLAAHGGFPDAAEMLSRRITRIAVAVDSRRQGIAKALVNEQRKFATQLRLDYLSVSFGFTEELWHFWHSCGFKMVRVGGVREASSGCYTAMALLPLSDRGQQLCQQAVQQLFRNRQLLPTEVSKTLWQRVETCNDGNHYKQHDVEQKVAQDDALNDDDWRELAGFAYASRTLDGSRSALLRLLTQSSLPLATLCAVVLHEQSMAEAVLQSGLSGKKALIQECRRETQAALRQIDAQKSEFWQRFCTPLS